MGIAIVILISLIVYVFTVIVIAACLVLFWGLSAFSLWPIDEPRWLKLLAYYCYPLGCLFMFFLFVRNGMRKLAAVAIRSRYKCM